MQELGGVYPDRTLESGGAPVLFHHDSMDHIVNCYYLLIQTQGGDISPKIAWTVQEPGGVYPDQTLEPGGAPVLFHQDSTDHVVNRRET